MSENNFNFNGSEVKVEENKGSGVTYVSPGLHDLQIIKMEMRVSSLKNSKYIDTEVRDKEGNLVTRQFYLNTEVSEGKSKSAFAITEESLKKLAMATGKVDKFNSITASSPEEFVSKMNSLFAGTWVRNIVKGKQIVGDKGSFIKSEMSDAFESVTIPIAESRLKFDPIKHIKYAVTNVSTTSVNNQPVAQTVSDDLPF